MKEAVARSGFPSLCSVASGLEEPLLADSSYADCLLKVSYLFHIRLSIKTP